MTTPSSAHEARPDDTAFAIENAGDAASAIAETTAADISNLDVQLACLQESAHAQYTAYRSSQQQLWRLLSTGYLWWREAVQHDGYLEGLYKAEDIRFHRSQDNAPNFSPLIRLVYKMDASDLSARVTISQWNKALKEIHRHYTDKEGDFEHNAVGKLTAFIESSGGVSGLTTPELRENDDVEYADVPEAQDGRAEENAEAALDRELTRLALEKFGSQENGIGVANIQAPYRVGDGGLILLMARRAENGTIIILGSSNKAAHIEDVAVTAAGRNIANLPPSLRAPTEIIATQAFPGSALPSSLVKRSHWFEKHGPKSDLYEADVTPGWTKRGRGRRLTSAKMLLLRGEQQDMLLSGSRVGVSTVTRCVLKDPLIPKDEVVHLSAMDRIERWLETGEIALLNAEPRDALQPPSPEAEAAAYELAVTSTLPQFGSTLSFDRATAANGNTPYQAEFKRDAFEADWTVSLPGQWFADLRQAWADPWFAGLGKHNQITRQHNSTLLLKVDSNSLRIGFNIGEDSFAAACFRFPSSVSVTDDEQDTSYASWDLAPVLLNLADAPVIGDIWMAGNAEAIVFRYATAVGDFEVAVPTLEGRVAPMELFYALGGQ
jgi:hypothetical protein